MSQRERLQAATAAFATEVGEEYACCILEALTERLRWRKSQRFHLEIHLLNGRVREATLYPPPPLVPEEKEQVTALAEERS